MATDGTRHLVLKHIEHSVDVAAPPEKVWPLVSDLPRLAEWSPQVVKSFVRGGEIREGTRLLNVNRRGLLVWPTRSRVVRYEPGREIAWRIDDNRTTWSFTLQPTPTGTRLVQRREAPKGLSELSISLTDRFLGGQAVFQAELQAGMRQTLTRVKHLAEQ
ncbi:SRPBCC family protein [Nocardioides jishulii]|uniref:SRPBCC family protein n=1 Tax=Nocardioides jishulii TaxID=2575440 RepID=A0A4U2YSY8_9ACTN|nr:SRPBCC family protein [Nocardioides jishulii]QCX28985.1 SRPBCC family protein [Nocardioides jishulii]TKI64114.1 SRPBCC family protein [Nocardioides jishulii]